MCLGKILILFCVGDVILEKIMIKTLLVDRLHSLAVACGIPQSFHGSCTFFGLIHKSEVPLQVFFPQDVLAASVLLYIATDDMFKYEIEPVSVTVKLIDGQNVTHNFEKNTVYVTCDRTPLEISVLTDLSKPVFYTRGRHIWHNSMEP